MEAKNAMMATQNVVPFPTEYHNASFLEPRDVPDIRYIRDKLRRIDPAANISYRKNPESDIGNAHLLARLINGKAFMWRDKAGMCSVAANGASIRNSFEQ